MSAKNKMKGLRFKPFTSLFPIVVLGFLVCAIFLYPFVSRTPTPLLDLSEIEWKACYEIAPTGNCTAREIKVPKDITSQKDPRFKGSITYFTEFTSPRDCLSPTSSCSLFLSEIGDAAEIRLNEKIIGLHGQLPPQGRYAKHYPVKIEIPPSDFNAKGTNRLTIAVHSFKTVQAGIRKGPLGIYTPNDAFTLARTQIVQSIFIPVLSAAMIFLLSLSMTFFSILRKDQDPRLKTLIRYSASISFFLFSFTELPREFLPISFAGFLHYFSRILSDLCFFQLMRTTFFPTQRWLNRIQPLYLITLSAYPLIFMHQSLSGTFAKQGFDDAYFVTRIAVPLLFLPHILGVFGSLHIRKTHLRRIIFTIFIATTLFQLNDSLVFHAFIRGTYFVKAYPLLIVLGMTFYLFHQKTKQLITETAVQMNQNAFSRLRHDLKTPVSLLSELIPKAAGSLPERTLALGALESIQWVLDSTFHRSSFNQNEQCDLSDLLQSLSQSIHAISFQKNVQFELIQDQTDFHYVVKAPASEIFRSLQNLIENAIHATPIGGKVTVHLSARRGKTLITIKDEGSGIPSSVIQNIYQGGLTSKPLNGQGLGLKSSFEIINRFGNFEIQPSPHGSMIRITLKSARVNPVNSLETPPLNPINQMVLVDDDPLVADFWRLKAEAELIKLTHFSNSEQTLNSAQHFEKTTPFYIDVNLGETDSGTELARKLIELGFENVHLATSAVHVPMIPGLKSVIGKTPVWNQKNQLNRN